MEIPTEAAARFIHKMQMGYNTPMSMSYDVKEERVRIIAEDLSKYPEAAVDKAWEIFPLHYKKGTLPSRSEVDKVVRIAMQTMPGQEPKPKPTHDDQWHDGFADEQMRTDAGLKALNEGYAIQFHEFCSENARPPTDKETHELQATAARLTEQIAAAGDHQPAGDNSLDGVIGGQLYRTLVNVREGKLRKLWAMAEA